MSPTSGTVRHVLRLLAAPAVVALALASAGLGVPSVWRSLTRLDDRYRPLSDAQAAQAPATWLGLDPAAYDFFRARVAPHDRYFFQTPAGPTVGDMTVGGITALVATYWLAPAIPVTTPAQATVVVSYSADPRTLGLRYASVETMPGSTTYAVSRVAG